MSGIDPLNSEKGIVKRCVHNATNCNFHSGNSAIDVYLVAMSRQYRLMRDHPTILLRTSVSQHPALCICLSTSVSLRLD
jgi:hypothetical protein